MVSVAHATTDSKGHLKVDPRITRSRELILDAALAYFLAHGYLSATIEGLAAEAGFAKRTVYNLFESKENLFRAVVGRATQTAESFIVNHANSPSRANSIDEELVEFAVAHAAAVVTHRVIATRRLLIGEAQRFPDLAADYYDRVPSSVIEAITARLQVYQNAGLLEIPHARAAAEHFAYLVVGPALDRALFQPDSIDQNETAQSAIRGAQAFLRAYRAGARTEEG